MAGTAIASVATANAATANAAIASVATANAATANAATANAATASVATANAATANAAIANAATANAADQVANTYELVENILFQLQKISPASMVKSQAVSKTFQYVYHRSQKLQVNLSLPTDRDTWGPEPWGFLRPLPKVFDEICLDHSYLPRGSKYELEVFVDCAELASDQWRSGGSWRSWLVCRPATTVLTADVEGEGHHYPGGIRTCIDSEVKLNLRCETGVTLGHLVDAAYELSDLDGNAGAGMRIEFRMYMDENDASFGTDSPGPTKAMDYHKAMACAWQVKKVWEGFDRHGARKD